MYVIIGTRTRGVLAWYIYTGILEAPAALFTGNTYQVYTRYRVLLSIGSFYLLLDDMEMTAMRCLFKPIKMLVFMTNVHKENE